MKAARVLGLLVGMAVSGVILAFPTVALAGSIGGTVKSAATGDGIEGIFVCAHTPVFGLPGGCDNTDAEGDYEIAGLQQSSYVVAFAEEGRQNYLAQWYPGKSIVEEAGWVTVGDGEEVSGIDAVLQVGGQVTGTVTDVEGGEPIEDIEVCARQLDRVTEFGVLPCGKSDADGTYTVQALPTGHFKLEFGAPFSREAPNYIRQYYPGKSSWSEAGIFAVTAGFIYPGIDAAMQRGIGITGTVTEVGGGSAGSGPRICAHDAGTEAFVQCTGLEADGTYWIPGLPFGAYKVSFAIDVEEEEGLILYPDGFVRQYYDGKPTFGEANVLSSTGPVVFTGIDAQLLRGPEVLPSSHSPAASAPFVLTQVKRPSAPTIRCRKGFRKRRVKGKRRCVKIHKKHRHARRRGPRARKRGR